MGIHDGTSLGCREDLDLDTLHEERPVSEDDEDEGDDNLAFPEPYDHSRRHAFRQGCRYTYTAIERGGREGGAYARIARLRLAKPMAACPVSYIELVSSDFISTQS